MPSVLQLSVEGDRGSVGRIAEHIGIAAMQRGWESHIAFGRYPRPSRSRLIRIGGPWDVRIHGLETRIFDRHGLASTRATRRLVERIVGLQPDVIHLHHLHGYFVDFRVLFEFLARSPFPVIWTFHDAWSLTGHCPYFEYAGCDRWKSECHHCPQKRDYPASLFLDRSRANHRLKKAFFTSPENMTIVTVSHWLGNVVGESFLSRYPRRVIHNGVDLSVFTPGADGSGCGLDARIGDRFMILGVANTWGARKGFADFVRMSASLEPDEVLVMVGLSRSELRRIPSGIIGLARTEDQGQLAALYARAGVFVNTTYDDSFPTTNLEALACGTPVITYRTGGSVEAVSEGTGFIVEKGDLQGVLSAARAVKAAGKARFRSGCRDRAVKKFNRDERFAEYADLYEEILKGLTGRVSNR